MGVPLILIYCMCTTEEVDHMQLILHVIMVAQIINVKQLTSILKNVIQKFQQLHIFLVYQGGKLNNSAWTDM